MNQIIEKLEARAAAWYTADELRAIRSDLYAVLAAAPDEVPGLLEAVRAGKIDGNTYSACFVGTIAKLRGCDWDAVPGLTPDAYRPAEKWCLNLRPGHVPSISVPAALTAAWIETWLAARCNGGSRFPGYHHP